MNIKGTLLAVCTLSVSGAFGDGYRNPPPTAEGIGKSGVNSVWVDDASAISYNPANLALQTNASLVVAATFARVENTYEPLPGVSYESDAEWTLLPNLYYSQPIGSGVVAGLGITTPHGQGVAWNESDFATIAAFTGTPTPYEATMALVDIGPSLAVKISDNLMVGGGLDLYLSQLTLKAQIPGLGPSPVDSEGEGYGAGIGGNLALTWMPVENHRLALTYKSQFTVDYEGDFELAGASAGDFEIEIEFPNIVGLGYGVQLTDNIQIEAMVEWVEWSINDSQTLSAGALGDLPIENNWDDTINVGFAGSWQASDSIAVRAGYQYLQTPIPDDTMTPLLADADRHAISFGAGYSVGAHTFDLAYTISIYDERNTPSGTYEIDSDLVGLTYSLSF